MELIIIRHAKAEDYSSVGGDSARALVEKGWKQSAAVGQWLSRVDLLPDVVLSSPLLRCRETSEGILKELGTGVELIVEPWLACGMRPSEAVTELRSYRSFETVAIVGHEPDLSSLVCELLGASAWSVEMKKATMIHISLNPSGERGVLKMMTPVKSLM